MASSAFAVVAGVGPGTGAAIARRFASAYPVACLARSPSKYEPIVQEIRDNGGNAIGISADVTDEKSVKAAFDKIREEYKGGTCAAAIFNASGPASRGPLLELSVEDYTATWNITWCGSRDHVEQLVEDRF